jgi:hypothetical protein
MKANVKHFAEVLADELIKAEKDIIAITEHEVDMWWLKFLRDQGQAHLWRKAIITRYMLK